MIFDFSRLRSQRHTPLLGIDIDAGGIRIVELAKLEKGWRIERYAHERLAPGTLRDGSIVKFDQATEALRRALKQCGGRTRDAALALPGSAVITRTITLPDDLSEDELEMQVEAEASQNLPFALDEISLDFGIAGVSKQAPHSLDIMLVAARRDKIDERLALAEAAGIRPLIMDIDIHAARAAMLMIIAHDLGDRPALMALFQIGPEVSSLSVLQGDALLYEREQAFGSLKMEQDLLRASASVKTAMDTFCESVTQELARALQMFFASSSHDRVDHVYLAGNGVTTPGLSDAVSQRISTGVTLANPFSLLTYAPYVSKQQLAEDAASCLTACGLAMRSMAR